MYVETASLPSSAIAAKLRMMSNNFAAASWEADVLCLENHNRLCRCPSLPQCHSSSILLKVFFASSACITWHTSPKMIRSELTCACLSHPRQHLFWFCTGLKSWGRKFFSLNHFLRRRNISEETLKSNSRTPARWLACCSQSVMGLARSPPCQLSLPYQHVRHAASEQTRPSLAQRPRLRSMTDLLDLDHF